MPKYIQLQDEKNEDYCKNNEVSDFLDNKVNRVLSRTPMANIIKKDSSSSSNKSSGKFSYSIDYKYKSKDSSSRGFSSRHSATDYEQLRQSEDYYES